MSGGVAKLSTSRISFSTSKPVRFNKSSEGPLEGKTQYFYGNQQMAYTYKKGATLYVCRLRIGIGKTRCLEQKKREIIELKWFWSDGNATIMQ